MTREEDDKSYNTDTTPAFHRHKIWVVSRSSSDGESQGPRDRWFTEWHFAPITTLRGTLQKSVFQLKQKE
jgi:hypothetical protein